MSEAVPLPDQSEVDWIKRGFSSRRGDYRTWRSLIRPRIDLGAGMHDAWRSLGRDDDRARTHFGELVMGDKMLCALTGLDIMESIYEHANLEPKPMGQTFGPAFVYRAMQEVFTRYYIYTKMIAAQEEGFLVDGPSVIMGEGTEYFSYGQMPSRYKEVDRRMVMVGMTDLAEPDTTLVTPELQEQLLARDNIQRAIADGRAILHAAQVGEPYDDSQGFAIEVTQWNV